MGQTYILVETEEKRATLQGLLQGKGEVCVVPAIAAVVEAQVGEHLARGEEGFLFKPVPASHGVLKKILKSGEADICLAFDWGDRGEYRSWVWDGMISQLTKKARKSRRLHLLSFDSEGLNQAMQGDEPIDSVQAACYYFEECFQRCLATHMQRLLGTRSGPGAVPLSMPVLTTLALMAERQHEVKEFSGKSKWHVDLKLQGAAGVFPAKLKEVTGICSDGILADKGQAQEIAGDLAGQSFQVVARQENALTIPAPAPYTLFELLFDAYRYCQIPLGEALQAANTLFAGVSCAGKHQGLISSVYPHDLGALQPLAKAAGQHVVALFGPDALQSSALAEFGILPVNPRIAPEDVSALPDVLQKVYDLVWRRALASQMQAAVGTETILALQAEKYRLESDCPVLDEHGFLRIYQYGFSSLLASGDPVSIEDGEDATVSEVLPEQRLGGSSELYNLLSLADDLAELGVERPEEVVQVLAKLCVAGYVKAERNGTLQCDVNLFKVMNTLNRAFPGMQGLNFIVYYAQTVDEVASGRKRFQMAIKQFDQNLTIQGKPLVKSKMSVPLGQRVQKSKSVIKGDGVPTGPRKTAPAAGLGKGEEGDTIPAPRVGESDEETAVTSAPSGVAMEESSAPAVEKKEEAVAEESEHLQAEDQQPAAEQEDDTVLLDEEVKVQDAAVPELEDDKIFQGAQAVAESVVAPSPQHKDQKDKGIEEVATKPCPECGRVMVLKGDQFGEYWACTGVPACRHTEGAGKEGDDDALSCPLCQKSQLISKRTPTGKDMYVCPRESCEFMAWSKPHAIHCPLCSSPFLVEKKGVSDKVVLRCPKAGCNYTHGMDDAVAEAPARKKKMVVRRKKGSGGGVKRKVVVRRKK